MIEIDRGIEKFLKFPILFKEQENKNIVPLFLHLDDCEIGNSLGSHSGEQKFGAVYLSLLCFPPHLVSKFSCMILTRLFYSYRQNHFSNKRVFKTDIAKRNKLSEDGLNIIIDGRELTLYFSCLYFGDKLGINRTCSFSESFKLAFYCKTCRASSKKCERLTKEDRSLLSNKENYKNDFKNGSHGVKEVCSNTAIHTIYF